MLSWKVRVLGAVALIPFTLTVAWAQDEADKRGNDSVRLEPISITATRSPIDAFDYPGMVSVAGAEEIGARQPSTPDDLLGSLPNVEFTGGPRRTGEVPSIRGFSGADVVVTVDGARQNFLSGHDGRFFIDPALLREAEVVRGPASSLYGSGATGGVIALRTVRAEDLLTPGDRAGVQLRGGYQDVNDETHTGVTVYGKPSDDSGLLASVSARDSGTIALGDGSELTNTSDDIASGLLKGRWQPGDHSALELSFHRFDNDAHEPNNGQGAGEGGAVDKHVRADTARARYSYADPASRWLDLDLLLYHSETTLDELRLDDDGAGPRGERLLRELETTGLRLDNRARPELGAADLTLTYGIEAYRDEQDGENAVGVPDAQHDFAAAFAQAELRWGELLVIPGLRFDHYQASSQGVEDLEDEEVSPRLAVTWKPTPATMLFASGADAFRAPTIDEVYPSGIHFQMPGFGVNRFVPNPDLKPQRTRTLEVGGGFESSDVLVAGDAFQLKLSHFEVEGEDFIDQQVHQPQPPQCFPPNCNGTTRSVTIPEAELWGDEIEAHYRIGRLTTELAFSRVDGEDANSGDKLGMLTPPQLTLGARYALPALESTLGGRVLRADDFEHVDDPAQERDAYTVVDLFYAWHPQQVILRGLSVNLGVDNAFDEAYARTYTDAVEPGRNVKVSVGYNHSW